MNEIVITQGDTYNFTVPVTDSNGVVFDLTGYSMKMTVKESSGKTEIELEKDATISSPTTGVGSFSLTPEDTTIAVKKYRYDIQISDGSANIYTVVKNSEFEITEQITTSS